MYELKYNNLTICAYDLAGQITKRRVWEQFFPIVDGIVFMVDASDKQRFEEAKNELQVWPRLYLIRYVTYKRNISKELVEESHD